MILTVRSPAKLNLFLRVLGKREDGYHAIASLMQTIDLCDVLTFSLADEDRLSCLNATIPLDKTNLILKAADLFREKTGIKFGIYVEMEKKIPIGAGLGGGSSNAAATLWALNQLHGKPASDSELQTWARELGSDIPFFFSSGTAFCTGRGEIIENLAPLPREHLWVVKPKMGLETKEVYQCFQKKEEDRSPPESLLQNFQMGSPVYVNDLEQPAFQLMPTLKALKNSFVNAGFHTVLMSGSGSSLYCLGKGKPPIFPDVEMFPVKYINRIENKWYSYENL